MKGLIMISRRELLRLSSIALATAGFSSLGQRAANAAKTYAVGKASTVPVKGGKTFSVAGRSILITQPSKGKYRAFVAQCTHAGARLDGSRNLRNNVITCPSHGAKFSADTGAATSGPASSALGKVKVSVSAGNLKVTF
jgi:nitrite reductase/ring-hydroxylating ferredoxin subunit